MIMSSMESEIRSFESESEAESSHTLPPPPPMSLPLDHHNDDDDNNMLFADDELASASLPPPTPTPTSATPDTSPTPPPTSKAGKRQKKAPIPLHVQLIGDLPVARSDAAKTFTEMKDIWYQSQRLGLSGEILEGSTCDCVYKPGRDDIERACGPNSNCINRLTQVECLPDDCRCKDACQNQRFQNKQYANIDVVLTEKKGYGLRAEEDLPRDTFIYEYIGDLVNAKIFKRRMREYAEEGIQHFYFMMLQKDEFIDATKNGGIGRFANHSCNPNCYVGKWTIGKRVRMGIFAKRDIRKWEELTFDYNVDRYGHEAQECYCGEPGCVGFIGGKTQTVSDETLDALGIDVDDQTEYKVTKRKKGKDLDSMPTAALRSVLMKEVPKVIQAIRQNAGNPKLLYKLLTRVKVTDDQATLRQIMRLRGLTLMKTILEESLGMPQVTEDEDGTPPPAPEPKPELVTLTLECLMTWPLMNKNKVDDSQVMGPVEVCVESPPNETARELAVKLKAQWEALEMAYRIPKRLVEQMDEEEPVTPGSAGLFDVSDPLAPTLKRTRYQEFYTTESENKKVTMPREPRRFYQPRPKSAGLPHTDFAAYRLRQVQEENEKNYKAEMIVQQVRMQMEQDEAKRSREIEEMKRESGKREEERVRKLEKKKKKEEWERERRERHRIKALKAEANKEKRLLKMVGAVVVKAMSKYVKQLEHDTFKKHAKELTHIIAEKEKKSSSYKDTKLESLSEQKTEKIKKYAKEYIVKVLHKLKKEGKLRKVEDEKVPPGSAASASGKGEATMTMSLEEAIGVGEHDEEDEVEEIEPDDESEHEHDGDDQDGDEDGGGGLLPPPDPESPMDVDVDVVPPTYRQLMVVKDP